MINYCTQDGYLLDLKNDTSIIKANIDKKKDLLSDLYRFVYEVGHILRY